MKQHEKKKQSFKLAKTVELKIRFRVLELILFSFPSKQFVTQI